jgi:2-oxoglutarate ferredoxin oxidoreductase subunit beta
MGTESCQCISDKEEKYKLLPFQINSRFNDLLLCEKNLYHKSKFVNQVHHRSHCYVDGRDYLLYNIRQKTNISVIMTQRNQFTVLCESLSSTTDNTNGVFSVKRYKVLHKPFNTLAYAIALNAGFVAIGYANDQEHLEWLIRESLAYKGFALIEVLHEPANLYTDSSGENGGWYSRRVYKVNDTAYDPTDKLLAYKKASEWGTRIPIGIIYKDISQEEKCFFS